jgi:molybdopterin converting factor subunit 1
MKLLYFAWMRQRIGKGAEDLPLPQGVATVSDLINHLIESGPGYAEAFADLTAVKVAINQDFADLASELQDSDEIAFFPPVTGG